jgi:hypothetical protein
MFKNLSQVQQILVAVLAILAVLFSARMVYGYYLVRTGNAAMVQVRTLDRCQDATIALAKAEMQRKDPQLIKDLTAEVDSCAKPR